MAKEFDLSQKDAINSVENSVVSAGAGSGKTSVLSERFSHLVIDKKIKVDQILTLTFTKKATVEMYGRIYKTLKEKAPDQVSDFYKAHIKTLDSYCSSVAKLGARFYGLSPDIQVDKEGIESQVSAMALSFIIENRNNEAIRALAGTKSFQEIADGLFVGPILKASTIAEPIDFDKSLLSQHKEIIDAWEKECKEIPRIIHNLNSAYEKYSGNRETIFLKGLKEKLSLDFPESPVIKEEDFAEGNIKGLENYIKFLKDFTSLKLPGGKQKDDFIAIKELYCSLREYIPKLVPIANNVYGGSYVKKIIPLMKDFQDKVNTLKRSQGILTHADVASLAVNILKDYPEIRASEKKKYKAIMIDEFQDNNSMQRDMLFLLAEKEERMEKGVPPVDSLLPDRLFFVGDEKQSIYRFRNADVSVFRSLSKDFEKGNKELKTNYRSDAALIQAFNTMFGGLPFIEKKAPDEEKTPSVFFTEADAAIKDRVPDYEAVYHEVSLPKDKKRECEKKVHIALCNQKSFADKGAAEKAEAEWVVAKIKDLLENGCPAMEKVEAKDIAILFRNYSLQPLYERTLLDAGIPYSSEVATGFFNDGPVNDIFSYLRILSYNNDTLSYMQVLKSPFVNLKEDEADFILSLGKNPFELTDVELADFGKILSEQSLNRYKLAKVFYDKLLQSLQTKSICKIVSMLWYESGYCYETKWNRQTEMYATMYDRIFELARLADEEALSLASFADSVRCYADESEKLENMDIPLDSREGVHIMTIYKSKGLEFPIVFVCGCHKGSARDKNTSPAYCSKEFGLCLNTPVAPSFADISKKSENYFYKKVHEQDLKMTAAELRRVAYVAFTRAEHALYVTGLYKDSFDKADVFLPAGEKNVASIVDVISPLLKYYIFSEGTDGSMGARKSIAPFDFEEICGENSVKKEEDAKQAAIKNSKEARLDLIRKAEPLYERVTVEEKEEVPTIYIQPSKLEGADSVTSNEKDSDYPYKSLDEIFDSTSFTSMDFGSIAHLYLEAKIKKEEVVIPNKFLIGLEDKKEYIKQVKSCCEKMAENFCKSSVYKDVIKSSWYRSEFRFRSLLSDKIVKGSMDLVFSKGDSYVLVDYKSNKSIEPAKYYNQLACYRQALSQILGIPTEKISCILYYLRFDKEVDVTSECLSVDLNSI